MRKKRKQSFDDPVIYLSEGAFRRASNLKYFTMVIVDPDEDDISIEVNSYGVVKGLEEDDFENGRIENPLGVKIFTLFSKEITNPSGLKDEDLRFCVVSNADPVDLVEIAEDPEFNDLEILVIRYIPNSYSLKEFNEQYSPI